MRSLLRSFVQLFPILHLARWAPWLLLLLGLLTALSDGASMSLIIPLIESQASPSTSRIGGGLRLLFDRLPIHSLWGIGLSLLLCVLIKNCLSYFYAALFHKLNATVCHRLRCSIHRQLLRVGQSYLDEHEPGKLLNILGSETWKVSAAFALLASATVNLCMSVIFGFLLLSISWKLTLITAGAVLVTSQIINWLTRRVQGLGREATLANAALAERQSQTVHGLRLVRAFGREEHEQERFELASQRVSQTFFEMDRACSLVPPISELLMCALLLAILSLAGRSPTQLGEALTFLLLLYRLQPRLKQLDLDRVGLQALSGSLDIVGDLLKESDKPYLRSGHLQPGLAHCQFIFENVSLYYEKEKRGALKSVSFSIKAGETTAVVGPSGAGKSSIIALLCRLYDPSSGRVLINGSELRELDLDWWRSQIAIVSQEIHLFNATVAENIAYGKLDANFVEIEAAARQAHALEFINGLSARFDTVLGDRGVRLSGGQRQRIALARALIRNPQILILDEATNSLDLISDQLVHDALKEFGKGRTVLIVTHRISTIKHADRIVVLEDGRVVESGTFQSLAHAHGLFSELCSVHASS